MANYIETKSTKPILSRVSYVGEYAYDVFGYVGGYLNDLNISHKNNEIIVASGLIAVDGKRIVINDEMSITLPYESGGGMMEYNLFLKVNMATPDNLSLVTSVIYANPSDYRNDDLFLNYDNGIKFIKLATIVNSSAGIQGVEKVIPSIKEEKENLLSTVDDLAFDSGWIELDITSGFFKNDTVKTKVRKLGKMVEIRLYAKTKAVVPKYQEVSILQIPSDFRPSSEIISRDVGQTGTATIYNCYALIKTGGAINLVCPVADIQTNAPIQLHATWFVD